MIFSRERQRRTKGALLRNGFQQTLKIERELAYDLDVRKLVAHVSEGMALYFARQLQRGQRPDGFGAQRNVNARTKSLGSRQGPTMGVRTGYMATRWWVGKVRGGIFKAQRLVKPYGGAGGADPEIPSGGPNRAFLLNILLKRGIDFQSVRGKAKGELQRLFRQWLTASVGGRVYTPGHINASARVLEGLR